MPVVDMSDLTRPAQQVVSEYLDAVGAVLRSEEPESVEDTLADLRAHLLETLSPQSTAAEARVVVGSLGRPDEYSVASSTTLGRSADADVVPSRAHGRVLGIPYEVRIPTGERVAARWWNPRDTRLFVPRVFGIGWDLNFGAVAVRLALIEPDAEDEPFASVPDRAFLFALLVPVAFTAILLGIYLALREQLPAQLPVHWDWKGTPDRFSAAWWAFLFPFALALLPTAWATWLVAANRSRLARGGAIGLATLLSSLAAGIWALTVATGMGLTPAGWSFAVLIVFSLAVSLAVLTFLARVGRAVEMERDLSRR